ncbi:MAG: ionic transporter y4hA [Betaproteobacteria bacterium]|nr:ionic transporter y4hA [Betaproteobacteria bacterium]
MAASGALFSWWTVGFPLAGGAVLAAPALGVQVPIAAVGALLIGCTFASVHHAETLAHRLGALFGSLVLAIAISVIEAGLIVSMMLGGDQPELARDSIFSALLIALNGILGVCLLLGGGRHYEQNFRVSASNAFLAVLVPLAMLTLVLPSYTVSAPGPVFTRAQLIFVAAVSFVLYGLFLYVQLVRHRSDFVADHEVIPNTPRPSDLASLLALALLLVALVSVVLLAKQLSPVLEASVAAAGLPKALVGLAIALLVLMPEGLTAIKAARQNRLQTALNLTLGSVLACVGLTIPAVAITALLTNQSLHLGLNEPMVVLLFTTFLTLSFTLNTGRSTVLEGFVHLAIFAAFVLFTMLP